MIRVLELTLCIQAQWQEWVLALGCPRGLTRGGAHTVRATAAAAAPEPGRGAWGGGRPRTVKATAAAGPGADREA